MRNAFILIVIGLALYWAETHWNNGNCWRGSYNCGEGLCGRVPPEEGPDGPEQLYCFACGVIGPIRRGCRRRRTVTLTAALFRSLR